MVLPRARPELSEAERKAIKREHARLKAEAQVARETRQAEVAEDASRMWGKADSNVEGHPYLVRKQISVPRGLRAYTSRTGPACWPCRCTPSTCNGTRS
jgi:phage/plasmid primase-like uncharacterized protein